jgi:hypothetical protein
MKTFDSQAIPAPPRVLTSLRVGFDAIANHIGLILFPIFLDLVLWFGPHLRVKTLMANILDRMFSLPGMNTPDTADLIQMSQQYWTALAEHLNFFSILRTYPVGLTSLMVSRMPIATPFGAPFMWEIPSFGFAILLWFVLVLFGLVLGTLFYALVEQASVTGLVDWQQTFNRLPWASLQVILLALFWVGMFAALSIPFSCLLTVLMLGGMAIGQIGFLLFGFFMVWLLFPLLFSAHGIFVYGMGMWASVREGFQMTRMTGFSVFIFVFLVFAISEGLDYLWQVPAENSWLALVAVIGHAFVTTGLLAASFIYYRDATRWAQRIAQQRKFSTIT